MKATFYKVKSFTKPYIDYIVRKMPDGTYRCDCPRFVFSNKDCKHLLKVRNENEKTNNQRT